MKIPFTISIFLFSLAVFSQSLKQEIENLPIQIHNGCDSLKHKKIQGITLGEIPLKIEIVSAQREVNGHLKITGIVRTINSGEPIDGAEIYLSIFNEYYCEILKKIGMSTADGKFDVTFENQKKLSLYIKAISYSGLEVKIGELLGNNEYEQDK